MSLADDFRARAKDQAEASAAIFALPDADFAASPKKQALAIIGQVNATTLRTVADAMDYLSRTIGSDSVTARLAAKLAENNAIRSAAAKGDWDEFNRIVTTGTEPQPVTPAADPVATPK